MKTKEYVQQRDNAKVRKATPLKKHLKCNIFLLKFTLDLPDVAPPAIFG